MARKPIPASLAKAAASFAKLHRAGREATNAANRAKTALRNEVKEYWLAEKLPVGSVIKLGGVEYRYEADDKETIDMDALVKKYDDGEITREQFLRMIKVDAKQAANVLGADEVFALTIKEPGKNIDIRTNTLPVEQADDEYIEVKAKTPIKRRVRLGGKSKEVKKSKRKIMVRK